MIETDSNNKGGYMDWSKEEIRQFRKFLNLSQKAFAQMLGVTREYVVYLETGKRKPSQLLLNFLNCLYREYQNKGGDSK